MSFVSLWKTGIYKNLPQILPELNKSEPIGPQPVTEFCLNFQKTHGAPTNTARHVGDLGNIKAEKGRAKVDITDKVASLFGPKDMSVSSTLISGIGHNQPIQVLSLSSFIPFTYSKSALRGLRQVKFY